MAKNQNTFEKRRREADKKRKAQEKRERRTDRKVAGPAMTSDASTESPVEDSPGSANAP